MTGIEGLRTGPGAHHRSASDARAFDDHAATPDKRVIFNHDRHRVGRLQDPANAHASREMDVGADVRATADGGPGVDHRVRTHPRSDIDETGHQHHAGAEVAAAARDGARAPRGRPRRS